MDSRSEKTEVPARVDHTKPTRGPSNDDLDDVSFSRWHRSWLQNGKHSPGCACQKCEQVRKLARAAVVDHDDTWCAVDDCHVCWAARAIMFGRI